MLNAELTIVTINDIVNAFGGFRVQALVQVQETDIDLLPQVYASINWGDGLVQPVNLGTTNLVFSPPGKYVYSPSMEGYIYHDYQAGNWSVELNAFNLRSPTEDTVAVIDKISLAGNNLPAPATPVLIGPVLPSDTGAYSQNQWLFNIDVDIRVLASNVKMILITNIGERLMIPNYGTNLSRLIFAPNDQITKDNCQAEIQRAITSWEPRVSIANIQINRVGRDANVLVNLVSLLTNQPFTVQLQYLA